MYLRPLAASAYDPDESPGVATGLAEIDEVLGGGYRKGLHLLVGFAHNGKTQVLLRTLWENRHRAIVYFSPDEPVENIILKLVSMATGEHVDEVFTWSGSKKAGAINEHFPHLVVDDLTNASHEMTQLIAEAQQVHQQEIALVAYDYLELFGSARGQEQLGAIRGKLRRMKDMTRSTGVPWLVLHQLNRGGANGRPVTMTNLSFGGEQEAITLTACWRQIFDPNLRAGERRLEEERRPTMHVAVIKNKQRPTLNPEGVQYAIEMSSGLIRPMKPGERIMTAMRDLA